MLAIAFLQWWYGAGWAQTLTDLKRRLANVYESFSVPLLTRTLFAPWRRIITLPGRSLQDRLHALADNAVSRLVGFSVRLLALIAAYSLLLFWLIVGMVTLLLWPLLPPLAVGLVIWGLIP